MMNSDSLKKSFILEKEWASRVWKLIHKCHNIMSEFFFCSRLRGVIENVNRSSFFLHSQKKINPPGIYEGNSPEIFDAVTFSKVCEQAALTQSRRSTPSDSRNKFWAKCHLRLNCEQTNMNFFYSKCCQIPLEIRLRRHSITTHT